MENTKSLSISFYRNLGKLFFAIAATDKSVKDIEFSTLKDLVKTQWMPLDNIKDSYGTDTAFQIEIVFDWLNNDEELNATACFNDFMLFKRQHENLFTEKVNRLIMDTASKIAESFSGKNKSELIMLAKLNIELKKP